MSADVLCTLRFAGPDFDGTLTPNAMREILTYERALASVARDCAKLDGRKRVPASLVDVALVVKRVIPGSSVVPIERAARPGGRQAPLPGYSGDYVLEGSVLIDEILRSTEFPSSLSEASRAKVAAIGSHLGPKERLWLQNPSGGEVEVDRAVRDKLRLAVDAPFDEERSVRGRILGFDGSKPSKPFAMLFQEDGSRVDVSVPDELQLTVRSYLMGPEVELTGLVRCRKSGEPLRMTRLDDITVVAPDLAPLFDRLAAIADLKSGWFDDEGEPFDRGWTDRVGAFLERLVTDASFEVPLPGLFPHADGSVTAEWGSPAGRVVLTFSASFVELKAFARGRPGMQANEFPLGRPSPELFAQLDGLFRATAEAT